MIWAAATWAAFFALGMAVSAFIDLIPKRKKRQELTDEELAEFIQLERDDGMRRWPLLYPTAEEWNKAQLRATVRRAASFPDLAREKAREFLNGDLLMERAARVDPVEFERRIRDMEREAGL